jgi:hypothetical protein
MSVMADLANKEQHPGQRRSSERDSIFPRKDFFGRARISSVELSPRLVPFRLEGFANAHAEGVTIGSLSDVGSQIDVILLAQLEP